VGVQHRVMDLCDRTKPVHKPDAPQVFSLIPLPELLCEILAVGPSSKEVLRQYSQVIARFGSELNLLLLTPLGEIRQAAPLLAEAVDRIRTGRVIRQPGYDGQFGLIRVFEEHERVKPTGKGKAGRFQLFR